MRGPSLVQFVFPSPAASTFTRPSFLPSFRAPCALKESHHLALETPEKLASVLLSEDKGWGSAEVAKLIADEKNTTVGLKNPIPVHLTYFTAWVTEDGQVETFVDVYRLDGLDRQPDEKKNEQDDSASGAPPTTGSTPPPSRKPIEG